MDVAAKYPIVPNGYGSIDTVTGIDLIEQSIQDILQTPIGSRFGREDYGSYIHLLLFEQNDRVLESLLYYYITSALELWENRIRVADISFIVSDTTISCNISYTVLNTLENFSYEYNINKS